MNHASEHDIDRVLTALRDTEPSVGLESRILQALEDRTPIRSAWFRWTPPMQWGLAALATAAVVLAVAFTTHNTRRPTSTIAQTWGDPSSPEASSPAKVGSHNLHHTRHAFAGTIGEPFLHPNTAANPGWFTITPSTRKWSGACSLVSVCARTASSREFSHQFCAYAI